MATLEVTIDQTIDDADERANGNVNRFINGIVNIDNEDEYIALRFRSVTVGSGSTIDACAIRLFYSLNSADEPLHNFDFEAIDDAIEMTNTAFSISGRTLTGNPVLWDNVDLGAPGFFTSPELKVPFQAVIDRAGWASGNSVMAIFNQPTTDGTRDVSIRTYDGHPTDAARLSITYTAGGGIPVYTGNRSGSPELFWFGT